MNKKISLSVAITVVILAVALTVSATMMLSMRYFSSMVNDVEQRQAMYEYINEIDASARGYYTIDEEKLRAALANGYVEGLGDPHAAYLSATEYAAVQNLLAGTRTGFGFTVTVSQDNRLIVSVVEENSPAYLAGMKAGDILLSIDGEELNGSMYATVEAKMVDSTKLTLSTSRNGLISAVELTVNSYVSHGVESRMLNDTVGYIGFRDFNSLTAMQFKNAYSLLTQSGATYFVFDVRNNEGGSLEAVKEILGYLLPRGPYMACDTKSERQLFTATDTYEMTVPSVTLINGNTAGEAEVFAAALQNLSKTKLVGTGSQGKAVVQEYFSIDSNKAAVRLTMGVLSLIKGGGNWEGTGLYPDAIVDLSYDKLMYFDLLTDEEDTQLQKALDILLNANVIVPPGTTTTTTVTDTDGTTTADTTTTTTK